MSNTNGNTSNMGTPAPLTEEKVLRDLQNTQNASINQLASLSAVTQGKDGKHYWLGVEMPAEVVPTLQYITSIAPNYVSNWLRGGVYDNSAKLFNKLNNKFEFTSAPDAAHRVGLTTALTMTGLLIGLQPITGVVHSVRQRAKDRKEIRVDLASIIDGNPHYASNEVIKTAMDRADAAMWTGFKQAAADLPTVLLNAYYAAGAHKELVAEKTGQLPGKTATADGMASLANQVGKEKAELEKARLRYMKEATRKGASEAEAAENWKEAQARQRRQESAEIRKQQNAQNTPAKTPDEQSKTILLMGTGALNTFLRSAVSKNAKTAQDKTCAYLEITHLQEQIAAGQKPSVSALSKKIVEIFQQNEHDRGRPPIGPVFLEKLQPLAERIAEVIANRELEPLVLVNLVGAGKVLNKRRFVDAEQLEDLLDEERKRLGAREKTPLDEFLADYQNPTAILKLIKENFKALEGDERAVFASLLSDDVLLHAGVKKSEIPTLRERGHDITQELLKARTVELAEKPDDELKKANFTARQIKEIRELSSLIASDQDKETKARLEGKNEVTAALRHQMLEEQLHTQADGRSFWAEKIARREPILQRVQQELQAKKKGEEAEGHAEKVAKEATGTTSKHHRVKGHHESSGEVTL